jgi:outer membrane protein TolC
MNFKKLPLIPVFLFMITEASAQQHVFSVDQAVDYAMQHAVQVKNALLDIKIQHQTNRQVTSAALPQVNVSVSVTHYIDIPVQSIPNFISPATYQVLIDEGVKDGNGNPVTFPAGGFGNLAFPFGTPWNASAGVEVSQLLFDGQVFIGLKARKTSMEFARAQADVTIEQIMVNVRKIYYQLIIGKQQMGTIDANIDRFGKLLNDTKAIYENGFAEKLDVDKVTVQLNNLLTEKIKLQNQLDAGYAGLKFLMHMPQKDTLILTDTLTVDWLKDGLLDESYEPKSRKEFKLAQSVVKLSSFNVQRYKLSALPTVALFGSYTKSAQRQSFNFLNDDSWFTATIVGLSMKVPVFNGFNRTAKLKAAKYELEKAQNNLEAVEALINREVLDARLKMISALQTADNQKRNMELAEKVYNTTVLKYGEGLGSNQEIYTAQTELKMAQNNYYSAMYDAVIARIDYLKATGKL